MMMTIALRFIPTLLEETDKIRKRRWRAARTLKAGNLIARAKAMIPLLVPLFVSSFRRAQRIGHGDGGALLPRRRNAPACAS